MSKLKDLFNYIFRAHEEYHMSNCTTEEVVAFATGLRDGELDKGAMWMEGTNSMKEYTGDSSLKGFYKQGYMHSYTGIDSGGFLTNRGDGEQH